MTIPTPLPCPEAWPLVPAGRLFIRQRRSAGDTDDIVTAFRDGQVTARSKRRIEGFTNAVQEIGYQGIREGDLVIHSMDGFAGAIGVSDSDGKASPVVHAYVPTIGADARFFSYMLRTLAALGFITSLAKGIRERSTAFDPATFSSLALPVPPLDEQRAIADYLDRETARIDALVTAKEGVVRLLGERRRALTTRLVGGYGSCDRLVATRSEWFPALPPSWQVARVRHVTTAVLDGPHISPDYVDGGIPFLSVRNIDVDGWHLESAKYISEQSYQLMSRRVRPGPGDVLLTKGGTTGIARAVDLEFPFQVWVHVAVLKLRSDRIHPRFLAEALNTAPGYAQSQLFTRGATNQDLALGRIKRIEIPLPPLSEQGAIVRKLDEGLAGIQAVREALAAQMALLEQRRQSLILAAVAGQIEVPVAA